jgi:hypothetical protein
MAGGNDGAMLRHTWAGRFRTLKNIPPFLALAWATGPALVISYFTVRLMRAALPIATST